MKDRILKAAFLVWVVLWAWFAVRDFFLKGNVKSYEVLLSRTAEGKRSYVTGDRLYEFLTFCRSAIPENATYLSKGLEKDSIDERRAVYYLYPMMESNDPDYIIVFDITYAPDRNYIIHKKLDDLRYILKRAG